MINEKKIVVTIEARMTSSRLPGKILMECCGKPLLQHMIERIRRSNRIDDIIVATTVNKEDDAVEELCKKIECNCFRGSEDDVLLRVLEAAKSIKADVIVETTGDCPVIDWRHIDYLVDIYSSGNYDYVANNTIRSFPDGFDVRIFSAEMLEEINSITDEADDHEHVSIYFIKHPEKYNLYNWTASDSFNRPELEITLDEYGDYQLINAVYEGLYYSNPDFACKDVIDFLDANNDVRNYVNGIKRTIV